MDYILKKCLFDYRTLRRGRGRVHPGQRRGGGDFEGGAREGENFIEE